MRLPTNNSGYFDSVMKHDIGQVRGGGMGVRWDGGGVGEGSRAGGAVQIVGAWAGALGWQALSRPAGCGTRRGGGLARCTL